MTIDGEAGPLDGEAGSLDGEAGPLDGEGRPTTDASEGDGAQAADALMLD
jgi:hypothetical protein